RAAAGSGACGRHSAGRRRQRGWPRKAAPGPGQGPTAAEKRRP
nr:hypothetical protein [Tanacetum cinerariifolium]